MLRTRRCRVSIDPYVAGIRVGVRATISGVGMEWSIHLFRSRSCELIELEGGLATHAFRELSLENQSRQSLKTYHRKHAIHCIQHSCRCR